MIPPHWAAYRRRSDSELVGYLVPEGESVVPMTLFGFPLAEATAVVEATALLETVGLSVLADSWQLQLSDGEQVRVKIREVTAERVVVVADDFGYGGNLGDAFVLDVPAAQLSR